MKCKKYLIILMILILITIYCIFFIIILKDFKDFKENNNDNENLIEESHTINEETKDKIIDWNYLKSVNQDIIGWIEIVDTKINYPILKDSNLFYLKHSYNRKYNNNGAIFTTNNNPFIDEETIIYGHNMKNGTMFSSLDKYLNSDFLYSHLNIKIYTPTGNYIGTIFSVYSIGINTENNNIKQLDFKERMKYYKKASKYIIDNIDSPTRIVKLCTCSYINAKVRPTDQRYYIIANIFPIK